jgi:NAD(P)-dependent dehydrogenase (short-subunit alcohol dehydrogenase family)
MGRLDGKVALISGGARGQGALEAELFAAEGASVVFGDVLDDEGRQVERRITEAGGAAVYLHLDVTSDDDWAQAVELTESRYGKLDVLVNNAGIARGGGIEETSEELWDQVLAVNTKGVFLGTRKALPAMRRAGGGSIINVSSIAGILGRRLAGSAYSASKGAVRTFTKSTAIQHAYEGIRCNSIHPGPVGTPMLAGATDNPEILAVRTNEVPLGRLGTSQDVAYGALYLASDESAWITGIELVIDGGITAQ